jgi:hypothetical protein
MSARRNVDSLAVPLCSELQIHPAAVSVMEVPATYLLHESSAGFRRRLLGNPECTAAAPLTSRGRAQAGTALASYDLQVRCFDDAVAFRVVFDHKYTERPTGQLFVMDVLLAVFLWLEPAQATLLAVSHVSRAWREASAYLPQWCVTSELLHPNASLTLLTTHCELAAAAREAKTDAPTVLGYHVRTRSDYLAAMRLRPIVREHVLRLRRRAAIRDCCGSNTCGNAIAFIVITGLLALLLYGLFEVGFRFGDSLGGDVMVFVTAGLLSVAVPGVLFCLYCAAPSGDSHGRSTVPVALVAALVSVALACPVALVAERIAHAAALREAPRIIFSAAVCTDPSRFAFEERPIYVQLENPWAWRIAPWPADGPAAVATRPCRVPPPDRAPRTWWADTYLGNQSLLAALQLEFNASFAQADGIQCSDQLVSAGRAGGDVPDGDPARAGVRPDARRLQQHGARALVRVR